MGRTEATVADFDLLRSDTLDSAYLHIYQWKANYNLSIWLKNQDIIELWWIVWLSGSIKTAQKRWCCSNTDGRTLQNISIAQLMMELLALTFNKSSLFRVCVRVSVCFFFIRFVDAVFFLLSLRIFFVFHRNESFYEITKLIWMRTKKKRSFVKS